MLYNKKYMALFLVGMVFLTLLLVTPESVEAGKKKKLKKLKKALALALALKSKKKILIPLPL